MPLKQTIWVLISLISFFCISTNQPFLFLEDGTLLYFLGMTVGLICTASPKHALS
jgi:hypothetical protein